MEDTEIKEIKDYFKRLQRVLNQEATFNLIRFSLVKKSRIDDVMCCIYATLPDIYKKMLKSKTIAVKYRSLLCYNMLAKYMAKRFFLDPSQIIVDIAETNKLISTILGTIERDIKGLEQMYEE